MKDADAIELIRKGILEKSAVHWADLGSGSGTFTKALAQLLAPGSTILAVDKDNYTIVSPNNQVTINFQQADFTTAALPNALDGILMANSLHYVQDQFSFIKRIMKHLNTKGTIIFVEYDTDRSNAWVPYPIAFNKLKELLSQAGFKSITKIGEMDSVYNQNKMYACVATPLPSS